MPATLPGLARTAGMLTGGATALTLLTRAAWDVVPSLGALPGSRRSSAGYSPNYRQGRFRNLVPAQMITPGDGGSLLRDFLRRGDHGRPAAQLPMDREATALASTGPAAALAATWFGHSSVLAEVDGHRVLMDPVWGPRASPSAMVGPRRLHDNPVQLAELPPVSAILISHDHYDHLDLPTVRTLVATQDAPFVVPLGVGAHLRRWGVPDSRVIELDWNASVRVGELELVCTEARHFSGRFLARDTTLWASWVLIGPRNRIYFGGDTGYTPGFASIGARHGPFALTLLPIGAYGVQWSHIHMTPEEAVRAHGDLGGQLLLPIHWATFDLAFHAWAEPVQRLVEAAAAADIPLALPTPGGRVVPGESVPVRDWWSALRR